jgi:hypothetical protein
MVLDSVGNDLAALSRPARTIIEQKKGLFIDGELVSATVRKFPIVDPSSGKQLGEICIASKAEVDSAVKHARKAFEAGVPHHRIRGGIAAAAGGADQSACARVCGARKCGCRLN